jgi:hypothetical protein
LNGLLPGHDSRCWQAKHDSVLLDDSAASRLHGLALASPAVFLLQRILTLAVCDAAVL